MNHIYIVAATFLAASSGTTASPLIYHAESSTGSQVISIEQVDRRSISYKFNSYDKSKNITCSANGVARRLPKTITANGAEIDSDVDGIAYFVDEYFSKTNGWLAIRIESKKKSKLTLNTDNVFAKRHLGCNISRDYMFILEQ